MKTLDGSLTIFDDGTEVFTPYNHNPKKNSPWVNLAVCNGVSISATKNIVKLHLTFKRKPFNELTRTILGLVKNALVYLNTKENKKRYEEMLKAADNIEDNDQTEETVDDNVQTSTGEAPTDEGESHYVENNIGY